MNWLCSVEPRSESSFLVSSIPSNLPPLIRLIRNQIKAWRANRAIARAYGTTHPERIRLGPHDHWLHVDPHDPRARKVLLADPLRQRFRMNLRFWWLANQFWQPAVIVDIGLNYGECLFSSRYPSPARAHGFEANPKLQPFLARTLAEHPDESRIALHFGLVSDAEQENVPFHIDTAWSGGSTAGHHALDPTRYETRLLKSITVDAALAQDQAALKTGTLLFKIDVEGFEGHVFRGMAESLALAQNAVGIAEFSPTLLKGAGTNVEQYWSSLTEQFEKIVFLRKVRAIEVSGLDFKSACQRLNSDDPHGDLLLINRAAPGRSKEFLAALKN